MHSEGAAYGQARGGGTSAEVAERLASIRQVRAAVMALDHSAACLM